jgi:hypothetical protein
MNDFPKLRKHLEALIIEFNEILQEKFEAGEIEAVELNISERDFVERSPRTRGILALVKLLKELDDPAQLELKHVLAAQSLLKIRQHRELATEILIQAIPHDSKKISEAATKALGEMMTPFDPANDVASFCQPVSNYYDIYSGEITVNNMTIRNCKVTIGEEHGIDVAKCGSNGSKFYIRDRSRNSGNGWRLANL